VQNTGTTDNGPYFGTRRTEAPSSVVGFMSDNVVSSPAPVRRSTPAAFGSGVIIGTLGGLIGLGGAEFRLPLLITLFHFRGLEAFSTRQRA
jgi:hypothetical protein